MTALLFLTMIGLFALGVPIAFGLGMAALAVILAQGTLPVALIAQRLYEGSDSFTLMAVPLFLLAGNLMDYGGISRRLVNFAAALIGHIRGGLAASAVVASMIFAGISGAAVADAVAIGALMIPAMLAREYDEDFVVSVQAAAGSIGIIIPPSIPMVIFGVAAEVSIGRLFLGGFLPGVLMGLALISFSVFMAKRRGWPVEKRKSLSEIWSSFKSAFFALVMPLIIIGGIIFGVFTPTEAAAIAAAYGLVVGLFIYGELKLKDLPRIFIDTAVGTATVMLVIAGATLFGWVLTTLRVPQAVVAFMSSINASRALFMIMVNILLLIVGTFLDTGAAIILLAPVLMPLVRFYQIDPVFFGVIMVVNLAIGMITPPYGVTLFACSNLAKVPFEKTLRVLIPVVGIELLVLTLINIFPPLVTFIPSTIMK